MPISPNPPQGITLIDFNVGAAAAVGAINPLGAQIDGLLAGGITPLQVLLAAQLNASLAAQATISLQVSDPLAAIRELLAAMAQLQAALTAALALPPLEISLGAELTATAALVATLQAQLGPIQLLIQAALNAKIPAIRLAADLGASLGVGPFFVFNFDNDNLSGAGAEIQALFNSGMNDGTNTIAPTGEPVFGIVIVSKELSLSTHLSAIIDVPTP